jgi:hypothetical protein
MLGLLLRLAFFAVALVGLVLLFFYAAVVAVIFIPVVMILLFLLRKKGVLKWTTVDLRTSPRGPHAGPQGAPPVIDHDPNDVTVERKT